MSIYQKGKYIKSERKSVQTFIMNFGPQHPAAHGILKIVLLMAGETILRSDPQFGLLHRGSEKLCESRSFSQIIPYFDRMDYVANLFQEDSIVTSIESIEDKRTPSITILSFRVICCEFSRILNHLLTMSAICLDLGAMGPIFWAFEEREFIMEFFERLSGARMHTALFKPFYQNFSINTKQLSHDILVLVNRGSRVINCSFSALLTNRAFKTRCSNIGSFTQKKIVSYGISGVIARSSGLSCDSRLGLGAQQYSIYPSLSFRSFLGRKGDCLDRFIVRGREVIESYRIIIQCLDIINSQSFSTSFDVKKGLQLFSFSSMESVINHFKSVNFSPSIKRGIGFSLVESPKGFLSTALIHSGSFTPYRVHLRSPVAHNLYLLGTSSNGYTFADFVSTFCSLDVVLGEIDR